MYALVIVAIVGTVFFGLNTPGGLASLNGAAPVLNEATSTVLTRVRSGVRTVYALSRERATKALRDALHDAVDETMR